MVHENEFRSACSQEAEEDDKASSLLLQATTGCPAAAAFRRLQPPPRENYAEKGRQPPLNNTATDIHCSAPKQDCYTVNAMHLG